MNEKNLLLDPAFLAMAEAFADEGETATPGRPARTVGKVLRLSEIPLRHRQAVRKSRHGDATATASAVEHIVRLPRRGEVIHLLTSGEYQGVHVIPALLLLAGQAASECRIATLSFSAPNVDTLCQLLDAQQIRRLSVLCSTYFKAGNEKVFQYAAAEFEKRDAPLVAARSHMKITLLAIGEHRLVITGSANLRSCLAVEQVSITNDPGLFRFYRKAVSHIMEVSE